MQFKVTKKYLRGPETDAGTFLTYNEARKFIQDKLAEDAILKVNVIYKMYEDMFFKEEFDQTKLDKTAQSQDSQGSQQKGTGQRFSPTPFNMTPQPKGLPRSPWVKDEDEGSKK